MMSLSRFSRLSRPMGLRGMATSSFKVKPNVDPNVKYTKVTATWRQLCDFELIANGGFAPLQGFLKRKDYESVCANFRLSDGKLWPIPIVFDIDAETKAHLESNDGKILITDAKGTARGVVHVEEIWRPDKKAEGQLVYGGNPDHCEIININENIHEFYAGGKVEVLSLPEYEDYKDLRRSPTEVRQFFKDNKWDKVVAFQTRNPMHFAHIELTKVASQRIGAKLFLNPVVGPTKPGDIDYHTRMRCYHAVLNEYPEGHVLLNTLPLAMRMGGPREAMLHALIRKNHGATHFIIGRDHAGPGSDSTGKDIYGAYEARDFLEQNKEEVGISPVPFEEMVYIEKDKKYWPRSQVPEGVKPLKISGTDVRRMLKTGEAIPEWFSPPRVVKILREATLNNSLDLVSEKFKDAHPSELVKHVLQEYGKDVAISFSGAEDVILIQYAKQSGLPFRVFSLDTGRLHPETYEFFEKVEQHYGIKIEYTFPDAEETKALVHQKGMFSFYKDGHQECCGIRKVTPLKGKLSELKAWITGVRKDQSTTRVDMKLAQVDPVFTGKDGGMLVKFNPLANMKGKDLWNEINLIEVPYNPLHSHGFVSIGCQPCTRPTNPGMHEREGRWWWENAATKECGLHKACDDESPKA